MDPLRIAAGSDARGGRPCSSLRIAGRTSLGLRLTAGWSDDAFELPLTNEKRGEVDEEQRELDTMARVASSVDNSMIESFWSTIQRELLDTRAVWETPEQLGAAIFEWIEAGYNPRRRHTALAMLSPVDHEHHWQQQQAAVDLHPAADGAAS
jgi:putative transposase